MTFEDLGLLFFSILMFSLLLTPASLRFARYIGAIDRPAGRSVHTAVMPRMGGLGMALALLVGLPLFLHVDQLLLGFLGGLLIITLTGMADDIWRLRPLVKMAGQLIACIVFIRVSGIYLDSFGNLFGLGEIAFPDALAQAVTLFCLLGVINAFNMSDGLDGLAAGMAAIVSFFFAALALGSHINIVFILAVSIFASALGFLKYNSYPARLFMGDTGSLMLGYAIGCLTVILGGNGFEVTVAPITIAAVVGLPIVDTLLVMSRRMLQGKSPLFPDKTHLHHRLLDLGLSHAAVVSAVYIWMILMGTFALSVKELAEPWQLLLGLLLLGLLYTLLTLCEHKRLRLRPFPAGAELEPQKVRHRLAGSLSRSMELLLYLIPAALCAPLLLATVVPQEISHPAFALAAFAVSVFFLKRSAADKINIIHGMFYFCSFFILYAWHLSSYEDLNLSTYATTFGAVLVVWIALKIRLGRRNEALLTSSFEILLIFVSWFLPYVILPALAVSGQVLEAARFACLAAIPLFVAIKLVTRRSLDRDIMAIGLTGILLLIGIRSM